MTTTIVFADNDSYVVSGDNSYATALAGPGDTDFASATSLHYGQDKSSSPTFNVWQAGVDFDGSAVASDQLATTSYLRIRNSFTGATGVSRNAELREDTWGDAFNTGDFRTPAQLAGLTLESLLSGVHGASANQYMRFGQETGVDPGASYTLSSSRNRLQQTPTVADEENGFWSTDLSGTSSDPALYYTTVPESTLMRVLGAQAQLSDGTHVLLQSTATVSGPPTILLRHHDGTSVTTIETVPTGVSGSTSFRAGSDSGMQNIALVVDASDNIYLIGRQVNSDNNIRVETYDKGTGHTWTRLTPREAAMPSYSGVINNVAAAWHNEGTGGTIVAVVSHGAARNSGTDIAYALLNCNFLLTGSGSLLRGSGNAAGLLVDALVFSGNFNVFTNETGTMLDVVAAPSTTNRGFVTSSSKTQQDLGGGSLLSLARYQLASGGASFSDVDEYDIFDDADTSRGSKDANAKARVIGISTSQLVRVAASSLSDEGITVTHWQNIGTSSTFTILSQVFLGDEGISTMPSAATLAVANNWDAVYDPQANKVHIYYFDTGDGLRLMRTGVDLNTGLADQAETEVDDAVGAAGSTNHAIRVHRGATVGDQVLISVANETSGGTHSTIYVTDSLNVPPTAPTLTAKANFDADDNATFAWTFNDPNAGDTQSAYQLQIDEVGTGNVVDTTKTTSASESHQVTGETLDNGEDFLWRVRTWDAADEEGPWSDYSGFTTSAAGTVTIIDPAEDNPAGVITAEYTIEWEVAGTTQDDYRVVLIRTDTEAEVSDTDWVNSSDTTFEVTGMTSDVEHRIEVTVRDAANVETNTDTVLITPSYSSPEQPTATATEVPDDGYILISVDNPEPSGDLPEVTVNEVFRRVSGSPGAYVKVGEADPDGSLRDYTAAAGVTYEYLVRGQA